MQSKNADGLDWEREKNKFDAIKKFNGQKAIINTV
jgi:hypothetical protein